MQVSELAMGERTLENVTRKKKKKKKTGTVFRCGMHFCSSARYDFSCI